MFSQYAKIIKENCKIYHVLRNRQQGCPGQVREPCARRSFPTVIPPTTLFYK